MSQSIAASAGSARQRLASSLAALQQDPNVPPNVLDIVAGLARAMGPLFQIERGTGAPQLLFTARAALQETLSKMQAVDQAYPGVGEATAAIAHALGLTFTCIREHNIQEHPAAPTAAPAQAPAPAPAPPSLGPTAVQPLGPAPGPLVQPAPMPLVQQPPVAQPVPLVQQIAQPVPLVQPHISPPPPVAPPPAPPPPTPPSVVVAPQGASQPAAVARPMAMPSAREPARPRSPTVFPETAVQVPLGATGLPRLEVEVDLHSESNFFTNFLLDIRDHGGIFIETYSALALHSRCEVSITFPGGLTAEVQGVVQWKRESQDGLCTPGLGVEITHVQGDGWTTIQRFMKHREPLVHE
ncbi:MAG: PilZ domain-containing protein [Deltaproteobacteria bacterium]|nr:PilZ domain-containing protein [Deltaproteobacteria bacterium]